MAPYSEVNFPAQYSRASTLTLGPEWWIFYAICHFHLRARDGRAFGILEAFLGWRECEWRLLELMAGRSRFFSFSSFPRPKLGCAPFPLGFSRVKVAHACRLEGNYVKSSLSAPLTISSTSSRQLSLLLFLKLPLRRRAVQPNCISHRRESLSRTSKNNIQRNRRSLEKSDAPPAITPKITFQLECLAYLRREVLITSSTPPARIISG